MPTLDPKLVNANLPETISDRTFVDSVVQGGRVNVTDATVTVTADRHAGKIILLNRAAGVTVTLPAATATGNKYHFIVGVVPTSNQHRINVVGDDSCRGTAIFETDNASDGVVGFVTGTDTDQINLNGTTTGGASIGDEVILVDILADVWAVKVRASASGTEATPFSTGQVS